jgi:hypothetical protein
MWICSCSTLSSHLCPSFALIFLHRIIKWLCNWQRKTLRNKIEACIVLYCTKIVDECLELMLYRAYYLKRNTKIFTFCTKVQKWNPSRATSCNRLSQRESRSPVPLRHCTHLLRKNSRRDRGIFMSRTSSFSNITLNLNRFLLFMKHSACLSMDPRFAGSNSA